MQLQAGYVLDVLKESLVLVNPRIEVNGLLESLTNFETDLVSDTLPNDKPELAALCNLLSRGLPTRPSVFVEEHFVKALNLGEPTSLTITTRPT